MANVSELITLGVGTPSTIPYLIRFGLGQAVPFQPNESILLNASYTPNVALMASYAPQVALQASYTPNIALQAEL